MRGRGSKSEYGDRNLAPEVVYGKFQMPFLRCPLKCLITDEDKPKDTIENYYLKLQTYSCACTSL